MNRILISSIYDMQLGQATYLRSDQHLTNFLLQSMQQGAAVWQEALHLFSSLMLDRDWQSSRSALLLCQRDFLIPQLLLQETRFRQRYLDMIVNPRPRDIFRIRSQIIRYIRRYLDDRDFTEVSSSPPPSPHTLTLLPDPASSARLHTCAC